MSAELAYTYRGAPGFPSFIIRAKKPDTKDATHAEVIPGLNGEVLLSGYKNTPTVVILKCRDVRKFLEKKEKGIEVNDIIDRFSKRKEDRKV